MRHKGRNVPPATIDHAAALRERLGRAVRDAWVAWAKEQANPKPHHLDSWEQLPEEIREVDRRIGQAVMRELVKRDPRTGEISTEGIVSAQNGKPFVQFACDISPTQLTPGKAREVALMLLEAADAAESDAVLMAFAREQIGLDAAGAAQLLSQFRKAREQARGSEVSSA